MIPEFGLLSLVIALMCAVLTCLVSSVGLMHYRFAHLQQLSRFSSLTQSLFVIIAFGTLMSCFAMDDFTLTYVAQNSNTQLPFIYKICALWGAHEGSLLLWAFILSVWMLGLNIYAKNLPNKVAVGVTAVMSAISIGFLLLLLHTSNPFSRLLPFSPQDGADLNPLLQDPGFVLHPPFLYMGYVGLAVPFAFAMVAMLFKENLPWAKWARPFALLAWAFLTVGITLGSWWAYYELGWGGWWFWDPVENASFMPWLVATALVHALYLTDKHKMFQAWSLLLALSAFILSLIGTFLVRSGVISSVHAFASDPARGIFILSFLAIVMGLSFALFLWRGWQQSAKQSDMFSREALMLLGNVLLFVAMLTVLLGTLYPIIAEVILGEKLSVGTPYYNWVFNPMVMPILILMALAGHVKWHQDSFSLSKRHLGLIGIVLGLALVSLCLPQDFCLMAKMGFFLALALILSTGMIAYKARKHLFSKMGMILAHLGVGIGVLGVCLTTSLQVEKDLSLAIGGNIEIQDYQFTFKSLEATQGSNYEGLRATFLIKKHNQLLYQAYPEKRYFIPRNLPMTETAIVPLLFQDLYIALGERLEDGSWTLRIYIKPFVRFIWLGGLLVALGALFAGLNAFKASLRGNIS